MVAPLLVAPLCVLVVEGLLATPHPGVTRPEGMPVISALPLQSQVGKRASLTLVVLTA
jgi:hypothetical protein